MESKNEHREIIQNESMDFNPFLNANQLHYSKEEISDLFIQSKQGDENATNKLVYHFSKIVESMILEFQSKNIPPKLTFTELYNICITELKKFVIKYDEKEFYKSVTWCIRQEILKAFASK